MKLAADLGFILQISPNAEYASKLSRIGSKLSILNSLIFDDFTD